MLPPGLGSGRSPSAPPSARLPLPSTHPLGAFGCVCFPIETSECRMPSVWVCYSPFSFLRVTLTGVTEGFAKLGSAQRPRRRVPRGRCPPGSQVQPQHQWWCEGPAPGPGPGRRSEEADPCVMHLLVFPQSHARWVMRRGGLQRGVGMAQSSLPAPAPPGSITERHLLHVSYK